MTNQEYVNEILGENISITIKDDTEKFVFGKDIDIQGEQKLLMFEFYVQNRFIKLIRNLNRFTIQNKEIDLGFDQSYYPKSKVEFENIIQKIKLRIEKKLKEPVNKNNVLDYFYTAVITQEYRTPGLVQHLRNTEDFNSENKKEVINDLKQFFNKYTMDKPIKIRVLKVVEDFEVDVEDLYKDFVYEPCELTGMKIWKLKQ